jgi:hypothetical protein
VAYLASDDASFVTGSILNVIFTYVCLFFILFLKNFRLMEDLQVDLLLLLEFLYHLKIKNKTSLTRKSFLKIEKEKNHLIEKEKHSKKKKKLKHENKQKTVNKLFFNFNFHHLCRNPVNQPQYQPK